MKILFVGEALSGFGGTETVIKKLTHFIENDTQEQHQYMLYFLCRNNKFDKTWLINKKTFFEYAKLNISFIRKMQYVNSLTKFIKNYQPDVIISFDITTCELAAKAIKKTQLSIPLVSWVHYSLEHKKHPECVTYADYHFAISRGIQQQLNKRGIANDKIFTIFNPVTNHSDVIARPDPNKPKTFIYIGRLKYEGQKRLKDMFDTFAQITGNWVLHIIGNGSDKALCQDYVMQLGIENKIKWHGWQPEPWDYVKKNIKQINALLLTSSFEGFGLVLVEAMSYGIFCISSDCPSGPADIIQNDINGKLYPLGELDILRTEITAIIDGKVLPSSEQIKLSIKSFYDDEYYQNVKQRLHWIINHFN